MKKMKKIELLLAAACVSVCACSYSNGNPQTPISTMQSHINDESWKPKTDDIQFQISPGWHDGKVFKTQQNLKANPVEKGKINVEQTAEHNI